MTASDVISVDVVVNNHNYGSFVGQAVESALAQDHPQVNVIVVDDGSSDNSREVLSGYAGRVKLVLKENGGQASAMNTGFGMCRGDVVIFLDADDLLMPTAARLAATAFAADPDAARLQFRIAPIDETGQLLPRLPATAVGVSPISGDLRSAELASPFEMPTVPTSANAFRTAALRQIMPIPEQRYGSCGADYYLVHLSTLLGSVIYHPEIGAQYRVHGGNAFQPQAAVLDLERIRREIGYQLVTLDCLSCLADRLALRHAQPIASMSNASLRVISLKLAPDAHPVPADRLSTLLAASATAARRRRDLSPARRIGQVAVLAAICLSPRGSAVKLATLVVFPELRSQLWPARRTAARRSTEGE